MIEIRILIALYMIGVILVIIGEGFYNKIKFFKIISYIGAVCVGLGSIFAHFILIMKYFIN